MFIDLMKAINVVKAWLHKDSQVSWLTWLFAPVSL